MNSWMTVKEKTSLSSPMTASLPRMYVAVCRCPSRRKNCSASVQDTSGWRVGQLVRVEEHTTARFDAGSSASRFRTVSHCDRPVRADLNSFGP